MAIYYQVFGTAIACYLSISMGLMFTWPSCTLKIFQSANTTLHRPMVETELALFGSLSSIGALLSTPVAGYYLDRIGRKYCAILASLTHVIAWSMIAACNQVEVVLTAIFLSGLGAAVFLVVPVYVSEICQESIRGAMTSGSMIFYGVGMLLSYLLGGCLEYKTMIYICLSISVIGVAMLGFMKESPTYLMKIGLDKEAAKSIAFYRSVKPDSKEVLQEIDALRRAFNPDMEDEANVSAEEEKLKPAAEEEKMEPVVITAEKLSLWRFLKKSRSTRQAMFVNLTLLTASMFQGLVVVQVYAEPLFEEAVPNMSATLCSVMLAVITVVAGLVAAYLTELAGRRPLMIYSSFASGLCCVILGTQLHFHWAPHWMTAVFIYLFCTAYTLGSGTVPFVLIAEVFLPEVKSIMSMLAIEWVWLCSFVILFIFNPLVNAVGLGPIFYLFAAICFLSSVFCLIYLPETKGLSVVDIQRLFLGRREWKR